MLALLWSCPPPGPFFGPCFPCPLFGFWSVPWFLPCFGSFVSFLFVCVSACCFAVVFSAASVCLLWCCWVSFFVVMWLPSPAGCCLPAPHRLFPCGVLVQLLCWSLPLGIWLLHATARLPCPNAWGVVVLCFLASFCFMAAKAFGPVWGLCYPLHHGAFVVVVLCAPALRYSSSDDPGPPLDTAKLHTRHSLLHVWHTLLLSFSAFPAPSLPPFCLVVCVIVGFGAVLPFVQFPLPSLRQEKSGAQLS